MKRLLMIMACALCAQAGDDKSEDRQAKAWKLFEKQYSVMDDDVDALAKEIQKDFPCTPVAKDVRHHMLTLQLAEANANYVFTTWLLKGVSKKFAESEQYNSDSFKMKALNEAKEAYELAGKYYTKTILCLSPEDIAFYVSYAPSRRATVIPKVDNEFTVSMAVTFLKDGNLAGAKAQQSFDDLMKVTVMYGLRDALSNTKWNRIILLANRIPINIIEDTEKMCRDLKTKLPASYAGYGRAAAKKALVTACEEYLETADKYDDGTLKIKELLAKLLGKKG